jgi:Fe-S-cluster containining protein
LRSDFLTETWLLRAETICLNCGGHCCDDAHPPVSSSCYELLTGAGVSPDKFEFTGYTRLRTGENGKCILSENGKCRIHAVKPETCRAGPFTFDVNGDQIGIYLKHESTCPIVKLLKEDSEVYRQQYVLAVQSITHLVQNLTADEIHAICQIDEPETEKVSEVKK